MSEFNRNMVSALAKNKVWLSKEVIPRFKKVIEAYNDNYQRFYEVLIKEKLVREDAYKSDRVIQKLEVPSAEAVSEDIKSSEIALRLSMLSSQFLYLHKTLDLTVDICNISFLKNLLGLFQYINWEDNLRSEESFMTSTLENLMRQIPVNSPIIIGLQSLFLELEKLTVDAMICLKYLTIYAKDYYKNFVANNFFEEIHLDRTNNTFDKAVEIFLLELQRKIKATKLVLFYYDLCLDAVKDNYADDSRVRQERILGDLFKEPLIILSFEKDDLKVAKENKVTSMDLKRILIEALIEAGKCSILLDIVVKKITHNQRAYHTYCIPFGQKIIIFLKNFFAKGEIYYNITYSNISTGLSINEKLGFISFLVKCKDLIKKLHVYSNSETIDIDVLEKTPDEKILNNLIRTTIDIKTISVKADAINKKFKDSINTKVVSKFKGMTNDFKNVNYGVRRIQDLIANYSNEKMKLDLETKLDSYISNQGDA